MTDDIDPINRNQVTEPCNFVWIPTGHAFGVPWEWLGIGTATLKTILRYLIFPKVASS